MAPEVELGEGVMGNLKKTEFDGRTAHAVVADDGTILGVVYQRETTKTGFRRGYCVGQVPCKAWFFRKATEPGEYGHEEGRSSLSMGPLYRTRAAAVEALLRALGGAA